MQTLTEKTTNIKNVLYVRSQKLAKSTVVSMDELFQLDQVLRCFDKWKFCQKIHGFFPSQISLSKIRLEDTKLPIS